VIKSWSWSRYADYTQCPRRAKLKHVDRHKEPGSKAMDRGAEVHDLISSFIKGKTKTLEPPTGEGKNFWLHWIKELKTYRAAFKKKNNGMTVEDDWAFTKDWERCRWDDWHRCWVRIKLDLAHPVNTTELVITDWKTGRDREEEKVQYTRQLELYALAALILHPNVTTVYPRLAFIDAETTFPTTRDALMFTKDDIPKLKKEWAKRTKPMFLDDIFPAKPSMKCRWCWFGQAKKPEGGPGLCEF